MQLARLLDTGINDRLRNTASTQRHVRECSISVNPPVEGLYEGGIRHALRYVIHTVYHVMPVISRAT